jgi:predicted TIM-barrel fold metal-dependent hydrolase
MQGKIALEEHFAIAETLEDSHGYFPERVWQEVKSRVLDIQERRIAEMDQNGIELMLLSLNAPAVQRFPDPAQASDVARKANDFLAEQVRKRPDRFQGLAALAMQDPEGAARELERCVKELGFRGALVNGFSQVGDAETTVYYDLPQYRPFWATVERLDVPFYLHPRHALRLMCSGLFDAHPRLQIILGHMGENLPFAMWRIDNANAWIANRHSWPAKKSMRDYFCGNFYLTTSGNFHTPALMNAMLEIGADRIMFSTDWPFENVDHAARWFDVCPISEPDRIKIGRENARRLFKLGNDGR